MGQERTKERVRFVMEIKKKKYEKKARGNGNNDGDTRRGISGQFPVRGEGEKVKGGKGELMKRKRWRNDCGEEGQRELLKRY